MTKAVPCVNVPASSDWCKSKKRFVQIKIERRIQQRRASQARYRAKKRAATIDLETTVDQLHHEVQDLQERRRTLYWSVNTRERAVQIVGQLFRLFRFGMNTTEQTRPSLVATATSTVLPTWDEQISFVYAIADRHLRMEFGTGVDLLITQMHRFSTYFDGPVLTVGRIEPISETTSTIKATFDLAMTITPLTIQHVFPHLFEHNAILQHLLGRRVLCSVVGLFEFDREARMVEIRWTIDWVAALLKLLRLDEVVVVLQHARITRDAYLMEQRSIADM